MPSSINSIVWGRVSRSVNSNHGELATWDPCVNGEGNCAGGCGNGSQPCCYYQYAERDQCMSGCVHPGVDIGVSYEPIYAAMNGTVEVAECSQDYRPLKIVIRAENGNYHIYGHMSRINGDIYAGRYVSAGTALGISGEQTLRGYCDTSGADGSGPHLHFEVRSGSAWGCAINPVPDLLHAGGDADGVYSAPGGNTGGSGDGSMTKYAVGDEAETLGTRSPLYAQADRSSAQLKMWPQGTKVCITGERFSAGDSSWYKVRRGEEGVEGYMNGKNLRLKTAGGCSSNLGRNDRPELARKGDQVKAVGGKRIRLRNGPGENYNFVGGIDNFEDSSRVYCVYKVQNSETDPKNDFVVYYQIFSSKLNGLGWLRSTDAEIHERNVSTCGGVNSGTGDVTIFSQSDRASANVQTVVRTGSSRTARIIDEIDAQERVCIVGPSKNGSGVTWVEIRNDTGLQGWVEASKLSMVEANGCTRRLDRPYVPDNILTNSAANTLSRILPVNGATLQIVKPAGVDAVQSYVRVIPSTTAIISGVSWSSPAVDDAKIEGTYVTGSVSLRANPGQFGKIEAVFLEVHYQGQVRPDRGRRLAVNKVPNGSWLRVQAPRIKLDPRKKVGFVRLIVLAPTAAPAFSIDNGDIHFEYQVRASS